MSVKIREVRGRRELRQFVRYPFELYRGSPWWVPPLIRGELDQLDERVNPAFQFVRGRYWLAEDGRGRIRGRIAGFLPDERGGGVEMAHFGYLDLEDDAEVAAALLGVVEDWMREEGVSRLEGPYGVTTFDTGAVLVEGFEELPTAASSYNHRYYGGHLESCGYHKSVDYLEFELNGVRSVNERVAKLAAYTLRRKKVRLQEVATRAEVRSLAPEAFDVINEAYAGLHGFIPLTQDQIDYYTGKYFSFLDPSYVKALRDESGRMIAVGISMPSLSRGLQAARGRLFPFGFLRLMREVKRTTTLDLYLVAVRKEWQNAGLPAILMHETHTSAVGRGLKRVETNGELESNEAVQALWELYEPRQHKRRRVYAKELGAGDAG